MAAPLRTPGPLVGLCRAVIRAASLLVPGPDRPAWREEWQGELWALHHRGARRGRLLSFTGGAISHASWEGWEAAGGGAGLVQDVTRAWRGLARNPGLTVAAVSVLALGIGANTALLGALRAALAPSSPYPGAERLVMVDLLMSRRADAPLDTFVWSYPKFRDVRDALSTLEAVAGVARRSVTLAGAGDPARITVETVTPGYLELLGVRPVLGRSFGSTEEAPAPGTVALLGHALWTTRFGGDPAALGRSVEVDGVSLEVVGVLPPDFAGLTGSAEAWIPMAALTATDGPRRLENPWSHWFRVLGRLRPGVDVQEARQQAEALGSTLTEAYPDPSGGGSHGVTVVPFLQARVNPVARLAVTAVSGAGLLLLLVACANVGGLLLARASARRVEVAVRAALGAGRGRLVREHVAESLLLTAAGGAAGIALALGLQRGVAAAVRYALDTSGTRELQFIDPAALGMDGTVLLAGVALALATGALAGLLPLGVASRPDLARDLGSGGRGVAGVGRRRAGDLAGSTGPWGGSAEVARSALVAGQVALTLVLLAGAGLMGTSLARLSAIGVGFTEEDVLSLAFERQRGTSPGEERAFEEALVERLEALPGVVSAAVAPCPPLAGRCEMAGLRQVDDRPPVDFGDMESILTYAVSEGYFATLGVSVREGRGFGPGDGPDDPPVAVVNETAARRLFGAGSALERRIAVTHELTDGRLAEVVGVVDDVRYGALEEPAVQAVYFSRRQAPVPYGTLLVRTSGDPRALQEPVRRTVAALDPTLALFRVTTLAELRAAATARTRVVLGLLLAFGLSGLLLTGVGLYGLVSYAVVRRTRELGLRMALGAAARDVLLRALARPVLLTAVGVGLGVGGAVALTRHLEGLLFGVEPGDPAVLVSAAAVLMGVAAMAAWLPARRATRIDPVEALRAE